jgi:long-chain fatty acid transport protein
MNQNPNSVLRPLSAFAFCAWTLAASATGFRLPDQDAFATARGEAFVATADNPSAIYYNPAGITQLQGQNVRGSIYGIYLDPSFKSPSGQTYDNELKLHAIPNFFYTYGMDSLPLSFGVGLYSPYGLSLEWPQNTGFRTVGTEAALTYITLNPTVAWQVCSMLSVGAGLTINYANIELDQGLLWPSQGFDNFRFKGDGWGVGYNLGVLFKPHEKVSFGASFRSTTSVDFGGGTAVYNNLPIGPVPAFREQSAANASLEFPLNAIFGVSFRPTSNWNFEFDADYTDWSALGTVTIHQASAFAPILPQNIPVLFNWQPSWYYEFGATRYLRNGWSVSAGYIYNENSVPDAHYTPLVADLDRHFFSVGTGWKGKHLSFDVAYQLGYGPPHTVSGSAPSAAGQTADGQYEFISHAVIGTLGWHF